MKKGESGLDGGNTRYVIVGNSIAGINAAETIRKNDSSGKITIISSEPYSYYSRPMIPGFLYGKYEARDMLFRSENFYELNMIDAILGKEVINIGAKEKEVSLSDGRIISYDKLLLATGGKSFIPPVKGIGKETYTFITLDDAKKLKEKAKSTKRFLVIGAGLIGLKVAESLIKLGKEVIVVELSKRVLSGITDEKASHIYLSELKKKGVEVFLGCTVEKVVKERGDIVAVKLSNHEIIHTECVVSAVGVRPNIDLALSAGIKFSEKTGIIVNDKMETSEEGIYAAGDAAEGYDVVYGDRRNLALWPNAALMGKVAGNVMSGKDDKYPGSYMLNSISFFDIPIISYGRIHENEHDEVLSREDDEGYRKILINDGKIVGAIFVNSIDRAGIINGLIRDGRDVSLFKDKLISGELGFSCMPKTVRDEKFLTRPKVRL